MFFLDKIEHVIRHYLLSSNPICVNYGGKDGGIENGTNGFRDQKRQTWATR